MLATTYELAEALGGPLVGFRYKISRWITYEGTCHRVVPRSEG